MNSFKDFLGESLVENYEMPAKDPHAVLASIKSILGEKFSFVSAIDRDDNITLRPLREGSQAAILEALEEVEPTFVRDDIKVTVTEGKVEVMAEASQAFYLKGINGIKKLNVAPNGFITLRDTNGNAHSVTNAYMPAYGDKSLRNLSDKEFTTKFKEEVMKITGAATSPEEKARQIGKLTGYGNQVRLKP